MNKGNTKLVQYGIQDDQSDLRIHVGVMDKAVYVFEPDKALEAIRTGEHPKAPAYQGKIQTANGYLIKPKDIDGCIRYPIPESLLNEMQFNKHDNPSEKGEKAERLANKMIKMGIINIVMNSTYREGIDEQIIGSDIELDFASSFQVKCDWRAGLPNLYIQIEECNPMKYT